MLSEEMKEALVQGLREIFKENIRKILLYGSVARKEATEESDIDIAIILKEDMKEKIKKELIHWAAEMDLQYEQVFSIIDILEENMETWGNILPFYRNVQEEGIVLWEAEQ